MTSQSNQEPSGYRTLSSPAGAVSVDFLKGKSRHRRVFGGGKNQAIAKAVGLHRKSGGLRIFDATAGLGRDAFVLACLGAEVLACERHKEVFSVLKDGYSRMKHDGEQFGYESDIKFDIVFGCAIVFLSNLNSALYKFNPDVIYIDPMHPLSKKSALSKKEMQIMRDVVGKDVDQSILADYALKSGVSRVVIKRPVRFEPLLANPSHSISGKTIRFDVYINLG